MGCLMAALSTIWLFYKAFNIGNKAPYTIVFRSMVLIGVERFNVLPSQCLQLCYGLFVINLVHDLSPKHIVKCIRTPLAMAIPLYIGGYFAIDRSIRQSRPLCIWKNRQKEVSHNEPSPSLQGPICGDGEWTIYQVHFCPWLRWILQFACTSLPQNVHWYQQIDIRV